jgi:hypothetical protein
VRQLVELGYRGNVEALTRDGFAARKREELERKQVDSKGDESAGKVQSAAFDVSDKPFLRALADREELVRAGKLTTILFIRRKNAKGQEVSGYIDYHHRLMSEDFVPYFANTKKMLPKPSDLSYYNWDTHMVTSNPSNTFQVLADHEGGLLFKNVRDRKLIDVDPALGENAGDNSKRTEIVDPDYIQLVIFDHQTRRK